MNRFLTQRIFAMLLFATACASNNAYGMLKNIKNTHDILNDDYKHLSLVHGTIAWETGFIRRMYDFGQIFPVYKEMHGRRVIAGYKDPAKTENMARLVHALFYRVPNSTSEADFGATTQLNAPYKNNPDALAEAFAEIVILCQMLQNPETARNAQLLFDTSFKKIFTSIALDAFKKGKKTRIFDCINGAFQECNPTNPDALYSAHTLEMVLLAFVYKTCSEQRSALKIFYETLNRGLENKLLKKPILNEWAYDEFEPVSRQEAVEKLDQTNLTLDELVYYSRQTRSIPAPVGYGTAQYVYDTINNLTTEPFPDCMDNTIRNFVNLLMYDPNANSFSLNKLSEIIGSTPERPLDSNLINFFKKYERPAVASLQAAHDEWVGVISNISGAVYSRKTIGDSPFRYELEPTLKNFIIVLNHILGLELWDTRNENEEFERPDFIQAYFPLLSKYLRASGYSFKNASKNVVALDDVDNAEKSGEKLCTTLEFENFECRIMTSAEHGELTLIGKEQDQKIEKLLLQKQALLSYPSKTLFLVEVMPGSDNQIGHQYLALYATHLENTNYLERIIHATKPALMNHQAQISSSNLLLRVTKKQPDQNEKIRLQCSLFSHMMAHIDDEIASKATGAALKAIHSEKFYIQDLGLKLFMALFEKGLGLDQATAAAAQAIHSDNSDVQILGIFLENALNIARQKQTIQQP